MHLINRRAQHLLPPIHPNLETTMTTINFVRQASTHTAPPFQLQIEHAYGAFEPQYPIFSRQRLLIGRDDMNTVSLSNRHRRVSRFHAEICWVEDAFWVTDFASKNGTRLNGYRLKPGQRYQIRHGDNLTMGDYKIWFWEKLLQLQDLSTGPCLN